MGFNKLNFYKMIFLCGLISGCAFTRPHVQTQESPLSPFEVYHQKSQTKAPLEYRREYSERGNHDLAYAPVMLPAKVIKVWVPAKRSSQDRRVLIGGHWVFLVIQESDWLLDHEVHPQQPFIGHIPLIRTERE